MEIDGEWRAGYVRDQAPEPEVRRRAEPGAAGLRQVRRHRPSPATSAGIGKGAKNPELAWALLKYLSTDTDVQVLMGNGLKNIPTLQSALDSPKLEATPEYKVFIDSAKDPNTKTTPATKDGASYLQAPSSTFWSALPAERRRPRPATEEAGRRHQQRDRTGRAVMAAPNSATGRVAPVRPAIRRRAPAPAGGTEHARARPAGPRGLLRLPAGGIHRLLASPGTTCCSDPQCVGLLNYRVPVHQGPADLDRGAATPVVRGRSWSRCGSSPRSRWPGCSPVRAPRHRASGARLFYLPALVPPVASVVAFVFLFNPGTGPVNQISSSSADQGTALVQRPRAGPSRPWCSSASG